MNLSIMLNKHDNSNIRSKNSISNMITHVPYDKSRYIYNSEYNLKIKDMNNNKSNVTKSLTPKSLSKVHQLGDLHGMLVGTHSFAFGNYGVQSHTIASGYGSQQTSVPFSIQLEKKKTIDLSFIIYYKGIKFYSSNCSIIKHENNYIINIRCVNYSTIDKDYQKNNPYKSMFITINKIIKLDSNYNIIYDNILQYNTYNNLCDLDMIVLHQDVVHNANSNVVGIEDIKLFNDNGNIIFIGTGTHPNNDIGMVIGDYKFDILSTKYIFPTFNKQEIEKNWVYFTYDKKLCVIYQWYPLTICNINNNSLDLIIKKDMPISFKNVRGSTCGIEYNNNIWFITHFHNTNYGGRYYHMFVIFDKHMTLLRFSKPFRFEDIEIEFCLGFVINDTEIIISYSIMDNYSKLGIYDKQYIINKLAWITPTGKKNETKIY